MVGGERPLLAGKPSVRGSSRCSELPAHRNTHTEVQNPPSPAQLGNQAGEREATQQRSLRTARPGPSSLLPSGSARSQPRALPSRRRQNAELGANCESHILKGATTRQEGRKPLLSRCSLATSRSVLRFRRAGGAVPELGSPGAVLGSRLIPGFPAQRQGETGSELSLRFLQRRESRVQREEGTSSEPQSHLSVQCGEIHSGGSVRAAKANHPRQPPASATLQTSPVLQNQRLVN